MADLIVLASDHRGYALKQALIAKLEAAGYEVRDYGAHSEASVNYPETARAAGAANSG